MKKQSLKLGLKKASISNLSTIQGGGGTYSVAKFCIETFTAVDGVCCDQTYPDTQLECRTITPGGGCTSTRWGQTC
ncbi:hypothetical protein [uncultured Kordia sp.]|uniref:hypothetical protein n=1 Tax=uncultured Kordia sp. TaxID=507699 RepID=UPI002630A355|nr:hypothetical protein [uncultured Kordia sp.]